MTPNDDPFAFVDHVMDDLGRALRQLGERLQLVELDNDGSLKATSSMLALKRGCRR